MNTSFFALPLFALATSCALSVHPSPDSSLADAAFTDTPAPDAPDAPDATDATDTPLPTPDAGLFATPRLIAPLSTSTVTSQRPSFRWERRGSAMGAELTVCRDRALTQNCRVEVFTGTLGRLSTALQPGWWFWSLRAHDGVTAGGQPGPVWQTWVGVRSADNDRDLSWGSTGDYNGDGFADLAIGAPQAGTVSLFYGSANGIATTPARVLQGTSLTDRFGSAVATAGDVDGDGFADLLVGAPEASASGLTFVGKAYVYMGSSAGIGATPTREYTGDTMRAYFGASLAAAGDVNGDGFGDVLLGSGRSGEVEPVRVYHGGASGLLATPSVILRGAQSFTEFGAAVAGAGDVNGDGFADVLVGAPNARNATMTDVGAVFVYYGAAQGVSRMPARTIWGARAAENFGQALAGVGDVNGDGFADVILSAPNDAPNNEFDMGSARVHFGSSAGLLGDAARELHGEIHLSTFGLTAWSAGDVNADGFSDLIVGALPGRNASSTAVVHLGSPGGVSMTADTRIEGPRTGPETAVVTRGVGDTNGDGFCDVVMSVPGPVVEMPTETGGVRVYRGSAMGLSATESQRLTGAALDDGFGRAVAGAL